MNRPETAANLDRLRVALRRHGVKVTSRAPYQTLLTHVRHLTGKQLRGNESDTMRELNHFCERGIAHDLPMAEWRPLKGYEAALRAAASLAEMTR